MARTVLGKKELQSAIKGSSADAAVIMLAESYDWLVRDLEYVLTHLSEENFQAETLARLRGEDA